MKKTPNYRMVVIPIILLIVYFSCTKSNNDINPSDNFSGELQKYGLCKEFTYVKSGYEYGPDNDCIVYNYQEDSTLKIKHINAGFNCCPEQIIAEVLFRNDSILIIENEINGFCDCYCLYDLLYEVKGLLPGKYVISVSELLLMPGSEKLEFEMDLSQVLNGSYCITRNNYPWSKQ